jgi:glycosyltransferase involved in cell wall biosynthesis
MHLNEHNDFPKSVFLTTQQKNYDPMWRSRAVLLPGYIEDYDRFKRMLPLRKQLAWGWKLFRLSRSFQAVITGSERFAYMFAFLQKFRRRKVPHIFMQSMWNIPSSRIQRPFRRALFRTIVSTASRVVVYSRRQLELYPQELGLPREKLVFLYSHTSLYGKEYTVSRGDYIFSGGDSNRDYATLIAAAPGLKCRVIIVTTQQLQTTGLPSNVEVIAGLPSEEFNRMMAGAAAVVVPLHPGVLESGGRSVYGNAMSMGKTVIVADDDAGDYITDGHDGLIVPAGQAVALHQAIARVLNDTELCTRLERHAKQTAMAFAPETFFNAIFALADECRHNGPAAIRRSG